MKAIICVSLFAYNVRVMLSFCSLLYTAIPNPFVTKKSFIPSPKPRDTDPPEFILSFNVVVAPPTYVTCQVGSTPVDVAVLSREVTAGQYMPSIFVIPVTNVTVTLRTREPGNYQCNVSVFRSSGTNLTDTTTPPIRISGRVAMRQALNVSGIISLYGASNSDR